MKFSYSGNGESNKQNEYETLRNCEGRLGLRRRDRLQGGNFLERLRDQNEDVKEQRHHRRDDIRRPPGTREVPASRENCDAEHHERNKGDDM